MEDIVSRWPGCEVDWPSHFLLDNDSEVLSCYKLTRLFGITSRPGGCDRATQLVVPIAEAGTLRRCV